ncbi:hypothetical protein [Kitasatospora sp. NPDC058046]|uniref:hypothetical protein n=1 Tax=Kitasatospora sp. NPDC058046 TaxID=3346312 RepID=UPI0036DC3EA7
MVVVQERFLVGLVEVAAQASGFGARRAALGCRGCCPVPEVEGSASHRGEGVEAADADPVGGGRRGVFIAWSGAVEAVLGCCEEGVRTSRVSGPEAGTVGWVV